MSIKTKLAPLAAQPRASIRPMPLAGDRQFKAKAVSQAPDDRNVNSPPPVMATHRPETSKRLLTRRLFAIALLK